MSMQWDDIPIGDSAVTGGSTMKDFFSAFRAAIRGTHTARTYEEMLRRFYEAGTAEEAMACIEPVMLTTQYDIWLGNYILEIWKAGNLELAAALEDRRFLLQRCPVFGVETAFGEFGLWEDPPRDWISKIEAIGAAADAARLQPDVARIDAVIEILSPIVADPRFGDNPPRLTSQLRNELGQWFLERSRKVCSTSDLDTALEMFEAAITLAPEEWPYWPIYLTNGSTAMVDRFHRDGSLRDIEIAVGNAEEAIERALPNELNLAHYYAAYGSALMELGRATDDGWYWSCAAGALETATALAHPASDARVKWFDNFNTASRMAEVTPAQANTPPGIVGHNYADLHRKLQTDPDFANKVTLVPKAVAHLGKDEVPSDSDGLIRHFRASLSAQPMGSLAHAKTASTLAALLAETRAPEARDEALNLIKAAVPSLPKPSEDRVKVLMAQAQLVSETSPREPNEEDAANEEATNLFRTACREAEELAAPIGTVAAQTWGDWASGHESWDEAAEAYQLGQRIQRSIASRQLARGYAQQTLLQTQHLARSAAHALIRLQRPRSAARTLERGRAQLMNIALERDSADLDSLRVGGLSELADRYERHLTSLDEADLVQSNDETAILGDWGIRYQQLRRTFDETVMEIRKVPGHSHFLTGPPDDVIEKAVACAGAPIVYLMSHETEGAALIADEDIQDISLPLLTDKYVREHVATLLRARPNYAALSSAVTRVGEWMWGAIEPMRKALQAKRVLLIPTGLAGLLPFQAAWTQDKSALDGRRYIGDELEVCFAPSALAVTKMAPRELSKGTNLVVSQPLPSDASDSDPLPAAEVEAFIVASALGPSTKVLQGEEATLERVLAQTGSAARLHFACHAFADLSNPLAGGLVLHGGTLTVRELLAQRVTAHLAVLSACETGIAGPTLPDEAVSLPTSLIEGGVGSVVASMWPVRDTATLLLMLFFYEHLAEGKRASEALRSAQRELRAATNGELIARLARYLESPRSSTPVNAIQSIHSDLAASNPSRRSFVDPVDWASFVYTGP